MDNAEEIKKILLQLRDNKEKIVELEKYSINDIISIALDNELYESLKIVFQPILINGNVKIFFDAFSTDILDVIRSAYNTKEEAIEAADSEYQSIKENNARLSEDDLSFKDDRTYEEVLKSKRIIPKEIKESIISSLFTVDFDLISQIKIKDSHARQISGIGHPILNINDIIFYSEPACLETCIELFNKNIQTTMYDLLDGIIGASVFSISRLYLFKKKQRDKGVKMKFANKIQKFMYGRYGPDDLYKFLFKLYICLFIISIFVRNNILVILELVTITIMFYRFFSKNIYKRSNENQKFIKTRNKILKPFENIKRNYKDKDHIYKRCHKCKTTLKLPLPMKRGFKHAKCPHCGKKVTLFAFKYQKVEIIRNNYHR